MSKPKSTLIQLAETILEATSRIDSQFEAAGLKVPSLSEPFNPADPATPLLFHPNVAADVALVSGAAEQLIACIKPPPLSVFELALSVSIFQDAIISLCLTMTCQLVPQVLVYSDCHRDQCS